MQKKLLGTFLALCMLLGVLMAMPVAAADVVEIATADDLVKLMNGELPLDGSYKLTADIDLTGKTQQTIGNNSTPFAGTFDGNGKTVSGIALSGETHVALFGKLTGTVQNLTVKGSVTGTGNWLGGVVGLAVDNAVIENCINECAVTGTDASANVGGIAGRCEGSAAVKNCVNNGSVIGKSNLGGIVGGSVGAITISGCWHNGAVESIATSGNAGIGGIAGYVAETTMISDCLSTGKITSPRQYVGGIIGQSNTSDAMISNCYANPTITTDPTTADPQYTRSICGRPFNAVYTNCYYAEATAQVGDAADYHAVGTYEPAVYTEAAFANLNSNGVWENPASPKLAGVGAASGVELKMTLGQTNYTVNGETKTMDVAPIIRNERTMLPVRYVAEALGAEIAWDGATSTATLKTADTEIKITVGATTATVNGQAVTLDSPAFIESSRTYMPVRFVAETLGATVAWDGATSTATITK